MRPLADHHTVGEDRALDPGAGAEGTARSDKGGGDDGVAAEPALRRDRGVGYRPLDSCTERRTSTMGLTALVMTQLAQTLLTRRHSPLVVATALGSSAVLVAIVQTPGVSHFFGCTPLGPVAWTSVAGATAAATGLSVLAPNWLAKTAGMVQPDEA